MNLLRLLLLLLCMVSPAIAQRARTQASSPTTGMLDVSDGKIYYEVHGNGYPLVLIHGGFGDRRMWDDQVQAFAKYFQVIRYDHRGFGLSSLPQGAYSPVDDLRRLYEKLNIERAHLIGNSMGGGLALDFALKRPELVAGLVIVSAGPNGYPIQQKDIDKVVAVFKVAEEQGDREAAELWLAHPMVGISSKKPGVRERLRAMVNENIAVFRMRHWPEEPLEPPASKRLMDISAPTLIIIGGRDTELVRTMGEAAAKEIPGAKKIVMAGADHLPQMVNPAEFNRVVLRFLKAQ